MELGQKIAEWRKTRDIALANEICEELADSMPADSEQTEVAVVFLSKPTWNDEPTRKNAIIKGGKC